METRGVATYEIDGVVPVISPTAFVHPQASLIGDVIVEEGCYIGPFASLRGDFGRVTIGAGSNVQDSCVVHSFPGADATLHPESHIGHGAVLHGCTVHSLAMVGMNAVVMDGAVVGEHALIAANSFVPAEFTVPARSMVGRQSGESDPGTRRDDAGLEGPRREGLPGPCAPFAGVAEALRAADERRTRTAAGSARRATSHSLCTLTVAARAKGCVTRYFHSRPHN